MKEAPEQACLHSQVGTSTLGRLIDTVPSAMYLHVSILSLKFYIIIIHFTAALYTCHWIVTLYYWIVTL